jgi:hypothetical protein
MEAEGPDGKFQADRGIANADTVPHANVVRNAPLELLHQWAVVGQPKSVEHLAGELQKPLSVANVWPADVQWIPECGW